jgi:hypothetical protein
MAAVAFSRLARTGPVAQSGDSLWTVPGLTRPGGLTTRGGKSCRGVRPWVGHLFAGADTARQPPYLGARTRLPGSTAARWNLLHL